MKFLEDASSRKVALGCPESGPSAGVFKTAHQPLPIMPTYGRCTGWRYPVSASLFVRYSQGMDKLIGNVDDVSGVE